MLHRSWFKYQTWESFIAEKRDHMIPVYSPIVSKILNDLSSYNLVAFGS